MQLERIVDLISFKVKVLGKKTKKKLNGIMKSIFLRFLQVQEWIAIILHEMQLYFSNGIACFFLYKSILTNSLRIKT